MSAEMDNICLVFWWIHNERKKTLEWSDQCIFRLKVDMLADIWKFQHMITAHRATTEFSEFSENSYSCKCQAAIKAIPGQGEKGLYGLNQG